MTAIERLAALLLERLKVDGKPDLSLIASNIGLRIREVDAEHFDGVLVRAPNAAKGIIGVRRSIREVTRKRFTIGHEIGHYLIPSHLALPNRCTGAMVETWDQSLPRPEIEANQFAAELILPERLVRGPLQLDNPSLNTIGEVAQKFETSLTATCYRFVELTDLPVVMVFSEGCHTQWYHRNDSFPFYLPKAELPSSTSYAARIFAGNPVPDELAPVATDAWLTRWDTPKFRRLLEHSVFFPNYNAVLTLLLADFDASLVQTGEPEGESLPELDPADFTLQRRRWPR